MEKYGNSPITYVNSHFRKKNQNKNISMIEREYSLKKNEFDPTKKSNNLFIKNLEKRMEIYYNDLCSSQNLNMKKFNNVSSSAS